MDSCPVARYAAGVTIARKRQASRFDGVRSSRVVVERIAC